MSTSQDTSHKWSKDQIVALIDSYKDEECPYAVGSPNYHNKHLRKMALERVGNKVRDLKPLTTDQECSTKFHTLRTQFNLENSKVKKSLASGTGTANVYTPSLWYFDQLKFLESYCIPKRSKNSLESFSKIQASRGLTTDGVVTDESSNSSGFITVVDEEGNLLFVDDSTSQQMIQNSIIATAPVAEGYQVISEPSTSNDSTEIRPQPAGSPLLTSSGVSSHFCSRPSS